MPQNQVLTPEQFLEWKHHPVTQAIFQNLEQSRRAYQDSWSNAEYLNDPVQNAVSVGYCKAIDDFTKISFAEIEDAE